MFSMNMWCLSTHPKYVILGKARQLIVQNSVVEGYRRCPLSAWLVMVLRLQMINVLLLISQPQEDSSATPSPALEGELKFKDNVEICIV